LFIDSLAKFKIVAKETDDNHRLAHKEKLIEAQGELLDAIDEGLSVNDTIRAAYEFRKRAYKMRTELSNFLREIAAKETGMDDFKEQVKMVNSKLKEEGIKTIPIEEILPDYEESEETAEKQGSNEQTPQ
jgi:predicted  nucleic acid-binding Zn-ribbon protein